MIFNFNRFYKILLMTTVALLGADNQANLQNNRIRITNNRERSKEQKHRIMEIDHQERRKGKNFMKRIKTRWDLEFLESRRTAQNLVDNGKRFKKEGWGNIGEQEGLIVKQTTSENDSKQLNWTTKIKIDVVTMNKEERAKGRGFMKRVKERWDKKYPEYQQASCQKLRDNAARSRRNNEPHSSSKERRTTTGSGTTARGRGRVDRLRKNNREPS